MMDVWRQKKIDDLLSHSDDEVVRSFDAYLDPWNQSGRVVEQFRDHGRFQVRKGAPVDELALAVGAYWCLIVHADVEYSIQTGLNAIRDSRGAAEQLLQEIAKPEDASEGIWHPQANASPFALYAAARWFDGAAKLYYRTSDHTQARFWFECARSLAENEALWSLRPDLESNRWRNADEEEMTAAYFRERRGAGAASPLEQRIELLQAALQRYEQEATDRGIDLPTQNVDRRFREQPREHREFLRGVSSLLHNISVLTGANGDAAEAINGSQRAEQVSIALEDSYRATQAVFQQALHYLATESFEEGRIRLLAVRDDVPWPPTSTEIDVPLHWPRGRFFARQRLLSHFADTSSAAGVLDTIEKHLDLIDEIQEVHRRSGDQQGIDFAVKAHSLKAARELFECIQDDQGFHQPQVAGARVPLTDALKSTADQVQQRLDNEELELVENASQIVRVANYKQEQARNHRPIVLRALGRMRSTTTIDEYHNFSERSRCRELLDLLAAQFEEDELPPWPEDPTKPQEPDEVENIAPDASDDSGSGSVRYGLRMVESDTQSEYLRQLRNARTRFEEWALRHPIPLRTHANNPARDVRSHCSEAAAGHVLFCYTYNQPLRAAAPQLAVTVFFDGGCEIIDLDAEAVWRTYDELFAIHPETKEWNDKFAELGEQMWQALLAPGFRILGRPEKIEQITLVPVEGLFRLPLHAALVPAEYSGMREAMPLAAVLPTAYSVSTTAHISMKRYRWRRPLPQRDAVLAALQIPHRTPAGVVRPEFEDVKRVCWPADRFFLASPPTTLATADVQYVGDGAPSDLEELVAKRPGVLIISGHGGYLKDRDNGNMIEPYLEFPLHREILTQYDIAHSNEFRMTGNFLAILAACVTGQGAGLEGGEVAGFVRACTAAGCGALAVTLWYVRSFETQRVVATLLDQVQQAAQQSQPIDLLTALTKIYRRGCSTSAHPGARMQWCPLAIYL